MNLLAETIKAIRLSGHTSDDIIFIGSEKSGHACTWEQYELIANIYYDNGCGYPTIALDLIIVFSDRQKMWRNQDELHEWWEYSKPFEMPKDKKQLVAVTDNGSWNTIEEIHKELVAID